MNIAIMAGGPSSERTISLQTAENISNKKKKKKHNVYLIDILDSKWIYNSDNKSYQINKHDFSLQLNSKTIVFDYAVIAIHGKMGEDGILQAYFEMQDIPYSSPDVLASALTYDKIKCKQFLSSFNIPMAKQYLLSRGEAINADEIIESLGLPGGHAAVRGRPPALRPAGPPGSPGTGPA